MIEPGEFQERVIGKTPKGGSYYIATFFDYHSSSRCPKEKANVILICEYDDNDLCINSVRLIRRGAGVGPDKPPFLKEK